MRFGARAINDEHYEKLLIQSRLFPGIIHIELTNHCNKACSMCFLKNRYKKNLVPLGYMDIELFKRIVDECIAEYIGEIPMEMNLFWGGESLLHPRFGEFVRYAKQNKIFLVLVTNGILLWERRNDLMDVNLITVSITNDCDGKTKEALSKFMEFKGGLGKSPLLQLKFFEEENWYEDVDWPIVDRVYKRPIYKGNGPPQRTQLCPHIFFNPAIAWDGKFSLCCTEFYRRCVIGDIKEDSIKTLWRVVRLIREMQMNGIFLPPCNICHKNEDEENVIES